MAEAWRPVKACRWFGIKAGMFEASSLGRVRTVDRMLSDGRDAGGLLLSPSADRDGDLRVKHQRRWLSVSVLCILADQGPPEVRHLNGNHQDNRPGNLAWGSHRDNERDKRRQKEGTTVVSPPVPVVTAVTSHLQG